MDLLPRTSRDAEWSLRARVATAATLLTLGPLFALSVMSAFPANVVQPDQGVRSVMAIALPQSWQFFTKSPDDLELTAYQVDPAAGTVTSLAKTPNSRPSNWFGLRRSQRSQGPEIAAMANSIASWLDCRAGYDCLRDVQSRVPVRVENPWERPTVCGQVVLVQTKPVPWAFRHDYEGWRLDIKAARIDVTCTG